MGRTMPFIIVLVVLLALTPIRSEDTIKDLQILDTVQTDEAHIIVTLEKAPEDLTIIEQVFTAEVELQHLSGDQYTAIVDEQELEDLLGDPNVKAIEEDEVFTIFLSDTVPLTNASLVHAKQFDSTNLTGLGQTVCVIDTGANTTHEALRDRFVAEKCFCSITDLGSGGCCSDNTSQNNDAEDVNGHGTHVTGIVAANGTGVKGMAPQANIVSIQVTNSSGSASFSDITKAVNWCANNASLYNISVITISLGGGSHASACDSSYSSLAAEIDTAFTNNVSVTAATGNSGSTSEISSPACIARVISVSSTTKADAISSFSNRNAITDLMAPGSSITSTKKASGTESRSGTSMSTPHVAGAILLLQQYKQDVEARNLTVTEVNNTLSTNGTSISDSGGSGLTFTRFNVRTALIAIDNLVPSVVNPNTTAQSLFIYNNITFIVNVTDVNRETIFIEGNWSGSYQNVTLTNNVSNQFNFTLTNASFSAGQTFQWRVHANDSHGNENITSYFNATILTGAPVITLSAPTDNTNTNNRTVVFNYSALEDVDTTFNCSLYINSVLNQTKNTTNSTVTQFLINMTEGTHVWNIACNDSNGLIGNSSLRTLIIDVTSPVFGMPSVTSLVELGDNQSFSVNVTDLFTSYANFSYLGENITLSNVSTNFSRTFTTVQNGTNTFVVYARDTAGNLNQTSGNFTVNDSIVGPRIINIAYTSTIGINSTQNVSAWVLNGRSLSAVYINPNTTNYTMSNNTFYNYTYSFIASSCGSQSFNIFANDSTNAGVTNVTNYTVNNCCGDGSCGSGESCSSCSTDCGSCSAGTNGGGGGGGGSAGGGSTTPSTRETRIIESASSDNPIEFTFTNENLPLGNVYIEVNQELANIKVGAEVLDDQPTAESPDGIVYKFLEFTLTNFDDSAIDDASIEFYVPATWVDENNIDEQTMMLVRYTDRWNELETVYNGKTGDNYYYEAQTPGFSYFAIVGFEKVTEEPATEEGPAAEITGEVTAEAPPQPAPEPEQRRPLIVWILAGSLIMLGIIILILLFFIQRRQKA